MKYLMLFLSCTLLISCQKDDDVDLTKGKFTAKGYMYENCNNQVPITNTFTVEDVYYRGFSTKRHRDFLGTFSSDINGYFELKHSVSAGDEIHITDAQGNLAMVLLQRI